MPVSDAYRREFYAEASDDPLLWLLELSHPDLEEPVRVVRDHQPLTHLGQLYEPAGFGFEAPEQTEGVNARGRIQIENVSRAVIAALRAAREPPIVTLKAVLASAPDRIEEEWPDFDLVAASYDAESVTGELAYPDLAVVQFGPPMTPGEWTGLADR